MKCPHCGEELGLNDICINPTCSNFSTKIHYSESSNDSHSESTIANNNTNIDNFSDTHSSDYTKDNYEDKTNYNNTTFNSNNSNYRENNTNNYNYAQNANRNFNNNSNHIRISKDEFFAFFGHKKPDYYLRYVDKYNINKAFTSWNWSCFFLTTYWLLYRKLYGIAVGYFALNLAVTFMLNSSTFSLLLRILLTIFANCLYIKSAENKIKKIRASASNLGHDNYFRTLEKKGGINLIAPIAAFIILGIASVISILVAAFSFTSVPEIPARYYYY